MIVNDSWESWEHGSEAEDLRITITWGESCGTSSSASHPLPPIEKALPSRYSDFREILSGNHAVYQCYDSRYERDCVVKVFPRIFARREACGYFSKLCHLVHPNIVRVLRVECDTADDAYLVMEYLSGTDLPSRSGSRRCRPADGGDFVPGIDEGRLGVLREIADALDYLHECGLCHGDVKPSNIRLTDDGHAKLQDFDFHVRGTPCYMAPEILRGSATISKESDAWSLAVVAYEMTSGELPFHFDYISYSSESCPLYQSWSFHRARDNAKHLRSWAMEVGQPHPIPCLSDGENAVFRKALSRAPEDRYESCTAFVEALAAAHRGATEANAEAPAPPTPRPRRKWLRAISVAALVIGACCGVVFGLLSAYQGRKEGRPRVATPEHAVEMSLKADERPAADIGAKGIVEDAKAKYQFGCSLSHSKDPAERRQALSQLLEVAASEGVEPSLAGDALWAAAGNVVADGRYGEAKAILNRFVTRFQDEHRSVVAKKAIELLDLQGQVGMVDRADCFGRRIDETALKIKEAFRNFGSQDGNWDAFCTQCSNVIESCKQLLRLNEQRNEAVTNRAKAEEAKKIAEEANAEKGAEAEWANATNLMAAATAKFEKMEFEDAGRKYLLAAAEFERSANVAKDIPKLHVIATIDGKEVKGAKLNDGKRDWMLPIDWTLDKGSTYGPYKVSYEIGGKRYEGAFDETTVNWHGVKTIKVVLHESKECGMEIVVALDCSGSVGNDRFRNLRRALVSELRKLKKQDRFNVISFRDSCELAFDDWQDVSEESVSKVDEWLSRLMAYGRTNIGDLLKMLIKISYATNRNCAAVIITDLDDNYSDEIEGKIRLFTQNNANKIRVYVYGIRVGCNEQLIKALAAPNGGEYIIDDGLRFNCGRRLGELFSAVTKDFENRGPTSDDMSQRLALPRVRQSGDANDDKALR